MVRRLRLRFHERPSGRGDRSRGCRGVALLLAASLPWLVTCGTPPSTDLLTTHPIQGGTDDTTHTFAVGIIIQMAAGTALCSGALLAPNLVATARHCVAAIPAGGAVTCPDTKFGAVTSASNIIVSTDASVLTSAAKHIGVSKVIVPSGTDQTAVCGNDIALLILSQNVSLPAYVTPVLDPPMTDHTRYSPTITAIGYGVSSATDMTGASAGTRRIKQDVALACIPNDPTFTNCYPSRSFPMTAAEFASGNATCEGDSGSDAYEQDNFDAGRWVGFGVLSRGASQGATCLGGIYTRFDAWSSLIVDAATQAAMAGGYDLPSWAMPGVAGDAGTGSSDAGNDAGGAAVDAGRADGSATPDASGGGTGGAGASSGGAVGSGGTRGSGGSVGSGGGVGSGGRFGSGGSVGSGGRFGSGGTVGSGGALGASDAGASSDGRADAGTADGGATDASSQADGSGSVPEGGLPTDASSGNDGGADARADGAMTGDAGGGSGGSTEHPGASGSVGSSLGGCSCATGGGGSPSSAVIVLGLGLGLISRRQRRLRR